MPYVCPMGSKIVERLSPREHLIFLSCFLIPVQNDWYSDGVEWHDTACYRTKQFVCEDSDKMVNFLRKKHPNAVI